MWLRLLDLRPGEEKLFAWLALFILSVGLASGYSSSSGEALFIKSWGVPALPFFFICMNLLVAAGSFLYLHVLEKVDKTRFYIVLLLGAAAIVLVLRYSAAAAMLETLAIPYLLVYLLSELLEVLVLLHFHNVRGLYMDLLQAKRIVPRVLIGLVLGRTVAGFTVPLILTVTHTADLLYFWAGSLVLSAFFIHRLTADVPRLEDPEDEEGATAAAEAREGAWVRLRRVLQYPLARWFLVASGLIILYLKTMEYTANLVFTQQFKNIDDLTAFYGLYDAIGGLLGLVVQIWLTPFIVTVLGLGVAGSTSPFVFVLVAMGFLPGLTFGPALGARFMHQQFFPGMTEPILNLLTGGLPSRVAERTRVVAAGLVVPAATIVVSVLLLLLTHFASPMAIVVMGVLVALLLLVFSLNLRRIYSQSVLDLIRSPALSRSDLERVDWSDPPEEVVAGLMAMLSSADGELVRLGVEYLSRMDNDRARQAVARCYDTHPDAAVRARAMEALLGWSDGFVTWARRGLQDEAPVVEVVLQAVIRTEHPEFVRSARMLLKAPSPSVRCDAALYLRQLKEDPDPVPELVSELLQQTDEAALESVLGVIAATGMESRRPDVLALLTSQSARVRQAAVRTLAVLPPDEPGRLQLMAAIHDPDKGVRLEAVQAVARFPDAEAAAALCDALADTHPEVVKHARAGLLNMEAVAIEPLREALRSRQVALPEKVEAVWILAVLHDLEYLREMAEAEVYRAYQLLHLRDLVMARPNPTHHVSQRLLCGLLEERAHLSAYLAVRVITWLTREEAYAPIVRAMESSGRRARAQAIETLLSLGEKDLTPALVVLFEEADAANRQEVMVRRRWTDRVPSLEEGAQFLVQDGDPYLLSALLFAARQWDHMSIAVPSNGNAHHPLLAETLAWIDAG